MTVDIWTVNDALEAPPATVTDEGTCAALESLARLTMTPPTGAALVSETVPWGCPWLSTSDALSETEESPKPDEGGAGDGDGAGAGAGAG